MANKPRRPSHGPTKTAADVGVEILGAERAPLSDLYHAFLRARWSVALLGIVVFYAWLNAIFALLYFLAGGVGVGDISYADAFFFSVHTMGTIGYGNMFPTTTLANVLVVFQSVTGLIVIALATGLIFAKFSRSTARVGFTKQATIGPMNGVPTLSFRLGNGRGNLIMEATLRLVMLRTERTLEGIVFYRQYDLPLARERSAAFSRSWTVMHVISPSSPLYGYTPERVRTEEVEILASVVGTDDTSLQQVHARHRYDENTLLWGARHVDVLSELPDGTIRLDLTKFHDVVATEATNDFPYRWVAPGLDFGGATSRNRPGPP